MSTGKTITDHPFSDARLLGGHDVLFSQTGGPIETNSFLFHGEFVPFAESKKKLQIFANNEALIWMDSKNDLARILIVEQWVLGPIVWGCLFPPRNQWKRQ